MRASLQSTGRKYMNHEKVVMRFMTSIKLFFKEKPSLSEESIQCFCDKVSLPKLCDNQTLQCEGVKYENGILKV